MTIASKAMVTAPKTYAAMSPAHRSAPPKAPRRVPCCLLGATQSSGTPPSSGAQTPSQWPSPMMAASSTRSSLGPHEEPPALRFADAETASQSTTTTEAQPVKVRVRCRWEPYKWNSLQVDKRGVPQAAKASDFVVLLKAPMPPVEVFDHCGRTPQPEDFLLPSCEVHTHAELEVKAREMTDCDAAFTADRPPHGKQLAMFGQIGVALPERGVIAVLAPGVPMAQPLPHEETAARTARRFGHGRRPTTANARTGSFTTAVPIEEADRLVYLTHQRAYYGVGVVYTAHTARAIRQLGIFELVMAHYRNGVRTGRPMAPMTASLGTSRGLALQLGAIATNWSAAQVPPYKVLSPSYTYRKPF